MRIEIRKNDGELVSILKAPEDTFHEGVAKGMLSDMLQHTESVQSFLVRVTLTEEPTNG